MSDQRQDGFDPTGNVDWGNDIRGGFLTGQTNLPYYSAKEGEKKQQDDAQEGVTRIANSFAAVDTRQD
jgi:hypothetical protein